MKDPVENLTMALVVRFARDMNPMMYDVVRGQQSGIYNRGRKDFMT